jgi:hypothetical protein
MTESLLHPIPGMPYRLDWSEFHPHNRALRDAARIKAQDHAHSRRMSREADRATSRAADAARMASPEMVDRKAAALAAARRMAAHLSALTA